MCERLQSEATAKLLDTPCDSCPGLKQRYRGTATGRLMPPVVVAVHAQ